MAMVFGLQIADLSITLELEEMQSGGPLVIWTSKIATLKITKELQIATEVQYMFITHKAVYFMESDRR